MSSTLAAASTLLDLQPTPLWLELPLFDRTGWKRIAFAEFAESIGERAEPKDAQEEIYVGLEHLDPQCLHIQRWGKGSDVTGTKLRFRKGDIIFGRRRAYQRKLAVAEFDGICSAHAMVVRAKPDKVLPEFLPFLMMSDRFMNRAVEISVGSLSPTINWSTLKLEEFDLPPLDQQRRIAEILWAMDEAMEAWINCLECLSAAEMQFCKELLNDESTDNVRLGDYIELISGQHIESENYKSAPPGTPYITGPADFPDGVIRISRYTKVPKVCCQAGDILVTCKGSGTGKLVEADAKYCISRQLMAVRPTGVSRIILHKILQGLAEQLNEEAQGLIPGISRSMILDKRVRLPRDSDVAALEQRFNKTTTAQRQLTLQIEKMAKMRREFINQLLARP
jgi:hypothetical protein